jgi:hypothetical protein
MIAGSADLRYPCAHSLCGAHLKERSMSVLSSTIYPLDQPILYTTIGMVSISLSSSAKDFFNRLGNLLGILLLREYGVDGVTW